MSVNLPIANGFRVTIDDEEIALVEGRVRCPLVVERVVVIQLKEERIIFPDRKFTRIDDRRDDGEVVLVCKGEINMKVGFFHFFLFMFDG